MKVTKKMYDKELRPYYLLGRMMSALLTNRLGIGLLHNMTKLSKGKKIKGIDCQERYIPSKNGASNIRIRIFKPLDAKPDLPAMLYNHGGGYLFGVPEIALSTIKQYITTRPCVVIAADYRKSVKTPYPAGFNDCYDTLLWMKENALSLGIDPEKFIIAGHSAGGGLTAALTLKARDTKDVNIAFQMPIYPMIDHKQQTESAKNMCSAPFWSTQSNKIAWQYYHRKIQGEIPTYASPASNTDYNNFPPTITFVGDTEPFKDETIDYVEALKKANIPVEFKLFKKAFHTFEILANSEIGREADKFQFDSYAKYYDKYL